MQVNKSRGRIGTQSSKRQLGRILVGISFLGFLSVGILIPFFLFTFTIFSIQQAFPILLGMWHERSVSQALLAGVFGVFALGVIGGALAGAWYWIQVLKKAGLVHQQMLWPFGKRRWNQSPRLHVDPETAAILNSSYRWAAKVGFAWLGLWALLGGATAFASMIVLSLFVTSETSRLYEIWQQFWTSGVSFAALMTCVFLAFLTGTPVAVFQWRRFVAQKLHFTDEEMQRLLR